MQMQPPRDLLEVLERQSTTRPEQLAYRFLIEGDADGAHETRTFRALLQRAKAIGAHLQRQSKPRERALLLYAPNIDFIEGFFGANIGGLIAVPAYPPDLGRLERSLPRLQAIIADCQASVVLTTRALLDIAEGLFALAPELRDLAWVATDEIPSERSASWSNPALSPGDVSFLQYTSGSTGDPKGVIVTHRNIIENLHKTMEHLAHHEPLRVVSWLPPYHDMGLIGALLLSIYTGGHCTSLSPLDFLSKPIRWLQAISAFQANMSPAPNFAFDLCARKATPRELAALDLRSWRFAPNAGEPIRVETLHRFFDTFKDRGFAWSTHRPAFGMAETTLTVAAINTAAEASARSFDTEALSRGIALPSQSGRAIVSCGGPFAEQELFIVDPETHQKKNDREIGEIWIRGSFVASGYWRRPELTAEIFGARLAGSNDGPFLRSGDLGFISQGELFITGRHKDLIIIRGRNHAPQDIELTIEKAHPAIRPGCVAAFSMQDNNEEESLGVVAEIDVRREINADELFQKISQEIATNHEISPAAIWLLSPGKLPKTSSGKLQRSASRRALQRGEISSLYQWRASEGDKAETRSARALDEATKRLLPLFAKVLEVDEARLDPDAPLSQYGLDSLAAIELMHLLGKELNRTLSTSLLLKHTTLSSLARYLSSPPEDP